MRNVQYFLIWMLYRGNVKVTMTQTDRSFLQQRLGRLKREAEEREAQRAASKFGMPYLDLSRAPVQISALSLLSEEEAKQALVAALEQKRNNLAVVVFNPKKKETQAALKKLEDKNFKLQIFIGSLSGLQHVWQYYRFVTKEGAEITGRVDIEKGELDRLRKEFKNFIDLQKALGDFDYEKRSTTELLEIMLAGALASRASDIHFEPETENVKLRLRLDGILHDVYKLKAEDYELLLSRIKLLSGLKLNIRTEAQDGRFTIGAGESEIEIRTSTIPSEYGETIVMRILDPETIQLKLRDLGLRSDDLKIVTGELLKPNGMILNTGPTGSGKTTTLYSFLTHVQSSEIKIITIEDPIEYHLAGVEQTQVDPEAGYSFVNGLRSILRQDPDVILVGEIRDLETAEIAMHAALTGHLVFSTLHTNDAAGAIPRLVDLGTKPAVIGPALNLIIAQRLVRRFCDSCKKPKKVDAALDSKLKQFLKNLPPRVDKKEYEDFKFFEPVGCAKCGNIGYRGRIGIFEFLEVGDKLEELIYKEATEVAIKKMADEQGMVTMQQDGILKAMKGVTDFEEVERATGPLEW